MLTTHDVIESVSDEKQTALGVGHFVTTRISSPTRTASWSASDAVPDPEVQPRDRCQLPAAVAASAPAGDHARQRVLLRGPSEQRLLIQRCAGCGTLRHPPGADVPECQRTNGTPSRRRAGAPCYSFVVNHYPQVPAFDYPLLVALIELEEGTRLVSNLVERGPEAVEIGMAVALRWLDAGDDLTLPVFAPA